MTQPRTTRRRVLGAGALLGLFGASGCLRLTQADEGGSEDDAATTAAATTRPPSTTATETTAEPTTAADETTAEPTEPADYPPGVSEDGVSPVLVQSHLGELAGKPVTVETRYAHERTTAKIDADAIQLTTGEGIEMYVADGQTYQRYDVAGQTIWGYFDRVLRGYGRRRLTGENVLRALLRGGDFQVTGTETNEGERVYLVSAQALEDPGVFETTNDVSRYFRDSEFPVESILASGEVTADGVITRLSASLGASGESARFSVETTGIGSTSVSKPDWVETAKAERARFDASLVDDDQYIALEHTGGQSIDCSGRLNGQIDAYDDRGYFDGSFAETTAPGDTLYLYKTDEQTSWGDPKLGVSKNAKPSSSPATAWASGAEVNFRLNRFQLLTYFPAT